MGWRKNTRAVIREYPNLRRRERELKDMAVTANYGTPDKQPDGTVVNVVLPGSGSASRTTEDVALRQLSPDDQRALDAVSNAIQTTMRYRNGALRVRIIDLVYWRRSHTLEGAAMALHVSPQTAKFWHNNFVELVDAYLRVL